MRLREPVLSLPQLSLRPGPYFSLITSWPWDGSWPAEMAALGPTPKFGESIAQGYFLVPPVRAKQAGCLIVRKVHAAGVAFPCPKRSAGRGVSRSKG